MRFLGDLASVRNGDGRKNPEYPIALSKRFNPWLRGRLALVLRNEPRRHGVDHQLPPPVVRPTLDATTGKEARPNGVPRTSADPVLRPDGVRVRESIPQEGPHDDSIRIKHVKRGNGSSAYFALMR